MPCFRATDRQSCRFRIRRFDETTHPTGGTLSATEEHMARARIAGGALRPVGRSPGKGRLRVVEECVELDAGNLQEASDLRRLIRCVNGPDYPQPYLVEGPPGHFRLYVGEAAERVRTARGIVSQ